MEAAQLSIAKIRERLAAETDACVLRGWCRTLAQDPRAGVRALAAGCLRRLEAESAERQRLAALFAHRGRLMAAGARHVAGVDEVGVGPLAGPVVAAAVVLPRATHLPGLDDSKRLSPRAREGLAVAIRAEALAIGVGEVEPAEIDRLDIYRASLEAMRRAVASLQPRLDLDHVLVDARRIPAIDVPQTSIVHGDAVDGSIAAASIVAKVHRDRLMREISSRHPGYGFERHMGYGTAEHLSALRRLGPSPVHRRSFAPVAAVLGD